MHVHRSLNSKNQRCLSSSESFEALHGKTRAAYVSHERADPIEYRNKLSERGFLSLTTLTFN